jgi:hypothetical protein
VDDDEEGPSVSQSGVQQHIPYKNLASLDPTDALPHLMEGILHSVRNRTLDEEKATQEVISFKSLN